MIKRVIMTLGFDQMHGLRAVWSSLPPGYVYNTPNHGDICETSTGEVVAAIGNVIFNSYWVVADKSDSEGVRRFIFEFEKKNKVRFEEVPTSVFYLDLALVPDSSLEKLKRSVPPDYSVKQVVVAEDQPEKFLVTTTTHRREELVATVKVIGGRFAFEYEVDAFSANYFENWMKNSRPITTE
jgi:hypothetical protein